MMPSHPRILVAYATGTGATAEIAAEIAKVLMDAGARVDLQPADEVHNVAGYDAAVLGSAIRAGKLFPQVPRLAERIHRLSSPVPMAYFVVCATLQQDTPANREIVHAYLEPLRKIQAPVDEGLFAGRIEFERLNPLLRMMLKLMKAKEGDWRDWEAIRGWADKLGPELQVDATTLAA